VARISLSLAAVPVLVDTKLKVDASGWAVEWQQFQNTGASPITITISNGASSGYGDMLYDVRD
jgi:hypothetical protein